MTHLKITLKNLSIFQFVIQILHANWVLFQTTLYNKAEKNNFCSTQICVVYVDVLKLFCLQSREFLMRLSHAEKVNCLQYLARPHTPVLTLNRMRTYIVHQIE